MRDSQKVVPAIRQSSYLDCFLYVHYYSKPKHRTVLNFCRSEKKIIYYIYLGDQGTSRRCLIKRGGLYSEVLAAVEWIYIVDSSIIACMGGLCIEVIFNRSQCSTVHDVIFLSLLRIL